jgi:hypothetical protein
MPQDIILGAIATGLCHYIQSLAVGIDRVYWEDVPKQTSCWNEGDPFKRRLTSLAHNA